MQLSVFWQVASNSSVTEGNHQIHKTVYAYSMITKDTREHDCPECYVEFIFLKNSSYAMSTKIVFSNFRC